MDTNAPEPTVCGRCRRPLAAIDKTNEHGVVREWHHSGPATGSGGTYDHEPEPVALDAVGNEQVSVCDFCSEGVPVWRYPCATFKLSMPEGVPIDQASVGDWTACQECYELIEAKNSSRLLDRCLKRYRAAPAEVRRSLRTSLRKIHRQFDQHRKGPAVPL